MITVTDKEHENKVASAEATFKSKVWDHLYDLNRGASITPLCKSMVVSHSNLIALRNYKSGRFEAHEKFNVIDPVRETGIYNNLNTIK